MRWNTFIVLLLLLLPMTLLTGCASIHSSSLKRAESNGALTSSLGKTICQVAVNEHKKTNKWPDALRLAYLGGLSTHNRFYDKDYAVYILDKPYHSIPAQMDSTQTFAFYGFYAQIDSSYYTYCRWYYQYGSGKMELSNSEGEGAAIHGMKLTAEEMLIKFFKESCKASCGSDFSRITIEHALQISETSPNTTAKQILFEFTYKLLDEYYYAVVNLDPEGSEFVVQFNKYSLQLGEFIFRQDWTQY